METSKLTTSSSSSGGTPIRTCQCGARMASSKYDPHVICASCIGFDCSLEVRCESCKEWSDDLMNTFLKHKNELKYKRENKKKKKKIVSTNKDQLGNVSSAQKSGVSDSESMTLGSEALAQVDVNKVIEDLDRSWDSRFKEFKNQLSSSLESSMSMMFNQLSKASFSAPSQVPGDKSLGKRRTAPSPEEPHPGKSLGGNQEEQVPGKTPSLFPSRPVGAEVPGPSGVGNRDFVQSNMIRGDGGLDPEDDLDEFDEDDDTDVGGDAGNLPVRPTLPPSQEIDTDSVQFSQLFDLVVGFFPQATVEAPPAPPVSAITEGIFAPAPSRVKTKKRFSRFERFVGVRGDIQRDVSARALSGKKGLKYLLQHERGSYHLAGSDADKPPEPNLALPRLTSPKVVSEKMSVSLSLEEVKKIESLLIASQESQSFSMWLFGGLLNYVKGSNFAPPDVALFERMCSSITGAQVRTNALLQKLQAFMVMNRRQLYLAHAPASLNDEQKVRLMSAPVFNDDLFNSTTLESVISEHQGDVSAASNQSLVKAISSVLPSLVGRGKKRSYDEVAPGMASMASPLSDPKASTSGISASSIGGRNFYNRGRGRGNRGGLSRGRGRGDSKSSGNPKKGFQN